MFRTNFFLRNTSIATYTQIKFARYLENHKSSIRLNSLKNPTRSLELHAKVMRIWKNWKIEVFTIVHVIDEKKLTKVENVTCLATQSAYFKCVCVSMIIRVGALRAHFCTLSHNNHAIYKSFVRKRHVAIANHHILILTLLS